MKKTLTSALAALIAAAAWGSPSLVVSVEAGPRWSQKAAVGPGSFTVTPQVAIWIESADGKFVDTIYATRKAGKDAWLFAGGSRRPEALPVWSHARGIAAPDGVYMPDRKGALPDAVSGSTPSSSFSKAWKVPVGLAPGKYRIRVELNSSFDWNEAYPDKLPKSDPRWSAVNGQPSVVYEALVELGGAAAKASLSPVGTGSLRGEDGALRPGIEGLTTALELAASIKAEYKP